MQLHTFKPNRPLSGFVDCFWYLQGYSPAHSRELTLPDGSAEVVIDLREDAIRLFDREGRESVFGSSIVCGPHSDYFVIDTDTARESRLLGIHFKPGGLRPFLKEPLGELLNKHVSIDTVWGMGVDGLRDELLSCPSPDRMFQVLERKLLSMAFRPLERHPAVDYALNELRGAHVTEVIGQIGMSHRRFNEIFKEHVGMAPKRLSRIYRFQDAMRFISGCSTGEKPFWPDIAAACGYFDQAHFIKDFQAFSGLNPSDYRPISGRHHNHAPLPG